MKKTTTILMGLFLCTGALAACGNKKIAPKEPSKGDFGYNIEFKEVFTGKKLYEAQRNLVNQVSGNKISSIKDTSEEYYYYSKYSYEVETSENKITLFSNGVATSEIAKTICYTEGKYTEKYNNRESTTMLIVKNQMIAVSDEFDEYGTTESHYINVGTWVEERDMADMFGLTYLATLGQIGIDTNGNGIIYFIDITSNTQTGYSKTGETINVYDYDISETLVMLDGNPLTGKPVKAFQNEYDIKYYDENLVRTNEPSTYHYEKNSYEFGYGKRSEYKNKDAFIKSQQEEHFAESIDLHIDLYNGGVLDTDKTTISGMSMFNSYYQDGIFDEMPDGLKKQTAHVSSNSFSLLQGQALAFRVNAYTVALKYDEVNKIYYADYSNHEVYATIKNSNLVENLLKVKDADDIEYVYSDAPNVRTMFEIEYKVSLEKVSDLTVLKAEIELDCEMHEIYM